jgi:acetyltransferase-like isoleucine patch superfamily enzyme
MRAAIVSIRSFLRERAFVSMKATVELSPRLKLGRHVRISSFTRVYAGEMCLSIGSRSSVATGCLLTGGRFGTRIGEDCLVGAHCTIGATLSDVTPTDLTPGTVIGNNVMIGSGVVIIEGTTIGNGVIIGPKSVVAGQIPDNAIVQGNPAQVIFVRR